MKNNGGGAAFPGFNYVSGNVHDGMTLRDYFAAKAMPAFYTEACHQFDISGYPEDWKMGVALDAYAMADAMLEAREK